MVQGQVERNFVATSSPRSRDTSSPRSRDHRDTADNLELGEEERCDGGDS